MSFIKSKHSSNPQPINISPAHLLTVQKNDWYVGNPSDPPSLFIDFIYSNQATAVKVWGYETEEQRNQEFEWILKQLDCKTNETGI